MSRVTTAAGRASKFIVAVVVCAMVMLCTFSHSTDAAGDTGRDVPVLYMGGALMRSGLSKKVDGAKILESRVTATVKAAEETTRSRQSGRNSRIVLDFCAVFENPQTDALSASAPALLEWCDMTPRYSVIAYLHLSDGKKSASTFVS